MQKGIRKQPTHPERSANGGSFDLSITPNPTSGSFTVAINSIKNFLKIKEISIRDYTGLVVKRIKPKLNNHVQTVDIQNLPAGVYVIQVFDGNEWLTGKIIKQ